MSRMATPGRLLQPSFMLPRSPVHRKLEHEELTHIFKVLDLNGDGQISQIEFVKGLRHHPDLAERLGLPSNISQESRRRDIMQLTFNEIAHDGSKFIGFEKFHDYYCPPEVFAAEESFDIPDTPIQPTQTAHRTASPPVGVPRVPRDRQFDSILSFATIESERDRGGPFDSFNSKTGDFPAYQDFVNQGYDEVASPPKTAAPTAAQVYHVPVPSPGPALARSMPPTDAAFSAPENQQRYSTLPFTQPVPIEQKHFDTPGFPGHLDPSEVEGEKGVSQVPIPKVELPALRPGGPWRPLSTQEKPWVPPQISRTESIENIARQQKKEREEHMHQHGIKAKEQTPHHHPLYALSESLFKPSKPQSHIVRDHDHNDFMHSLNQSFKQLFTSASCSDSNRGEKKTSEQSVYSQRVQSGGDAPIINYAYARC